MPKSTLILVALLPLAGVLDAQGVSGEERFDLFTNCDTLSSRVTVQGRPEEEAESAELEERIRTMVEGRLRVARLYIDDNDPNIFVRARARRLPRLVVNVTTLSPAFWYAVSLRKRLHDGITNEWEGAFTWVDTALGIYSDNTDYIFRTVSEALDRFILEYLRVNESAC